MLRNPQREHEDRSSASLVSRMARYRRPSNASSSNPSPFPSPLPPNDESPTLHSNKHAYLSPEERRHADFVWSESSTSPHSSHAASPNIDYDRELPDLPPDALSELSSNKPATRDNTRGDDEVRSRHLSQYETPLASPAPSAYFAASASSSKAEANVATTTTNTMQSAALRFASASTSAAVSAGLGLKKLGKKASAARLRRPNAAQQAQKREANYAALQATPHIAAYSPHSASEEATLSGQSDAEMHYAFSNTTNTFVDRADPDIGLPYHVVHNVHVDVGPHGYTGLPSSWAQVLLSVDMDIHQDPQAAARFVQERTEYFVQHAVERGGDAEDTRRILSQRLAADADLSAVLASATPSRPSQPRRDSSQSNASSSYSSVLDKGWDLSSPPKPQAAQRFSPLPVKSPLLPDFAAEDYDDWADSLISSIPSTAVGNSGTSPQSSSKAVKRASHRRSRSLSQLVGANSLNGLGIGIGADATPRRTAQREQDLLSASNATPKASHHLRASIGLDAENGPALNHPSLSSRNITNKSAATFTTGKLMQSVEDEVEERLRESLDVGNKNSVNIDDDEEDVEHVHIAQAAIATKGVLRPIRASQLSAPKVSPSASSVDFGSPRMSPSTSISDLQARSPRSPRHHDTSRLPSSQFDTRTSHCGSTDSYATAGSRQAFISRSSFSNAPPKIYTENVSTFADREITSSPLDTSSSGHSSMRIRSPALTVATSSMGHGGQGAYPNRSSSSPGLSVRDSASPEVPPKDYDWRSRSPSLSVSASESGDGVHSPSGTQAGWRYGKRGPSSPDSAHGSGHYTQDSWTSTAPSITSSEGSHSANRGLGLRERRQAPPRIYPPSTSTRWGRISQNDDSASLMSAASSNRRLQQSPIIIAPMQRKASADSLMRPVCSPMSDRSHGSASLEHSTRSSLPGHSRHHHQRQQQPPSSASPVNMDSRSPHSGFNSPAVSPAPLSDRGRGSVGSFASSRDSMGPPPPPPPKPAVAIRKQPDYILPGADGFYTMPSSSAATGRSDAASPIATLHQDHLRPPPLSPAFSPASSTETSDYHAAIEEWMRDDYSDRSPATTTSELSPSPSSSSSDSPLPPLPKEEDEMDASQRASPYLRRPSNAGAFGASTDSSETMHASESAWRKVKPASPAPSSDDPAKASSALSNTYQSSGFSARSVADVPPRLELSKAVTRASSFEPQFPPLSPAEFMEMLDDDHHRPEEASEQTEEGGRDRKVGGKARVDCPRDRDDTRSIISIGPRAKDDARRFPVSMHYASGFDMVSMLGDDSEAIRSFRELMLARQSMYLEEMLPMQMGLESAPPVPALPSMKELEAKVAAAEQMRSEDARQRKAIAEAKDLPSAAASPSLSESELEAVTYKLPPKLSHLSEEMDLQPMRKNVLRNMEMIGDGESGPVFAANDVIKNRRVAIKMVQFVSDVNEEPSARLLGLVKEVRVWRRCRHVNVLDLYSTVLADNSIWIVQELAERSLADVIAWKDSGVDLNEARMSRIMGDLLDALQFLHNKGILHRDVRSDNVMISSSGVCKLSDFTHAGELGAGVSTRHSVIGTPYWMAPEVIKANNYDMRCDVWSVGVVLWEMIEGDPPRVDFPPLRAITLTATLGLPALKDPSSLSHELKSFLHWATEMDAEKRPSAETLAMSDFLSDPCSRASIVAMLDEARNAEREAARLEAADFSEVASKDTANDTQDLIGGAGRGIGLRQRDSWSSDSTTKG
ncbi:related to Serine/threonine kinase [Ustilago bromivora]|uniref:Related to Serine/threonine kinase n=1 Tax=Ustilago bromivora TaxID=307758 RepID=A0A1K0GCM0_9BASI|nr:related to Serine/threonine kinase [Ustilago bromivora]SYW85364.1 related to Serine/threonine kinase [Ustilago bromivora]